MKDETNKTKSQRSRENAGIVLVLFLVGLCVSVLWFWLYKGFPMQCQLSTIFGTPKPKSNKTKQFQQSLWILGVLVVWCQGRVLKPYEYRPTKTHKYVRISCIVRERLLFLWSLFSDGWLKPDASRDWIANPRKKPESPVGAGYERGWSVRGAGGEPHIHIHMCVRACACH